MLGLVRLLKLLGAVMEFFLGIPLLGGLFIVSMGWAPLGFMLVYYIVVLILAYLAPAPKWGPAVGLLASILGYIPVLGMIMHWVAFLCLLIDGITNHRKAKYNDKTI